MLMTHPDNIVFSVYHANDEKPSVKNSSRSASARPKTQPHAAKVASVKNDSNGEPDLIDVIRMLRHPSYEVRVGFSKAAAVLRTIQLSGKWIGKFFC